MQFQRRSILIFMLISLSPLFFPSPLFSPSHNKMSISFYLILFLLCISFQACHAKSLHSTDYKFQKKLQAPIKGKLVQMVHSWDKPEIECMKLCSSKPANERETVKSKRPKFQKRKKHLQRLEELKKVSWRVPDDDHKKVKGNNGVFNSDYEHARTHPPSHN